MKNFNPYLLLCVSVFITLLYGSLRNLYSKKYVRKNTDFCVLNGLTSAFSLVILLPFAIGMAMSSMYTVLLGFLYGIATMSAAILTLLAFSLGSFSYTTVIISSSMVIPALSGAIFWHEPINIWQFIGVMLVIVTLILSVDNKGEERRCTLKWLLCCVGSFAFSGAIGILQKMHQSSVHKDEINFFLLEAFFISIIFSAVLYFLYWKRPSASDTKVKTVPKKALLVIAAVSGVCVALANLINMYLSGAMPSAIFFPIVNGGNVVLSIVAGVTIFKEKLSGKQWCGLVLGAVSILLLCNVF